MKKSEFFACSQFLADWPDGCSFHDVLVGVEDGDLAYVVDPDYRGWRAGMLALQIELTERKFRRFVCDLLADGSELEEYTPEKKPATVNPYFGDIGPALAALTIRK